ncbi:MAG TPA: hypothetical protein VLX92_25340 [Kofleriaceae bacterium]|nr:hypothetical protein [Kofleriaceae bacterium]
MARRLGVVAGAIGVLAIALAVLAPLRPTSGDTVAARLGGLALRCGGGWDMSTVDWVHDMRVKHEMTYYQQFDERGQYSSIFGPAPALVMAIALADYGPGATIADAALRARERDAAACLVALAAALLAIACATRGGTGIAAAAGACAMCSFAGAATLGQGLWQATVALPVLVAALAALAWEARRPALALVAPAAIALAVMLRPTIAPLALGLAAAWALRRRTRRTWIVAGAIALAACAPLVAWNAIHLWSPLPIGQLAGNSRLTDDVFTPGRAATGLLGLLVSPARGVAWFAPIAIAGVALGLRRRGAARWIAGGAVLQLVAMAVFFKWHGGLAFGPRLLAETTWVAIWLAADAWPDLARRGRIALAVLAAWTAIVGLCGLWRFHPEQWEMRRLPDTHAGALWDVADSPLPALFSTPSVAPMHDSPPVAFERCMDGTIETR